MDGTDRGRAPRGAGQVVHAVLRNRDLRRVEAAYAGFNAAELGVWVAILVYAYDRGGNAGVATVIVAQLLPATLFAPVAGVLADRYRPVRVLAAGYLVQAAAMAATAGALFVDAPLVIVYGLAGVAATAVTITRPTQAVIVPTLAREPVELTAVNVVSTWIDSAANCIAPAVAGVLLATTNPATVFAVFALVVLGSALLVARLPAAAGAPAPNTRLLAGASTEVAEGVRALRAHRSARLVVSLMATQLFLFGVLDVIVVVLAIDVLGLGQGGAGYLTAVFGLGGVAGAAAAVALVGRRRLAPPLAAAILVWGCSFILLGIAPSVASAFALLGLAGVARSVLEVAGRTLLQRTSPSDVLARVFGLVEGIEMGALALGSLAVPALVALAGVEVALIAIGAALLTLLVARFATLLRVDAEATVPVVEIALLRALPIFAALPPPSLEGLARNAVPVHVPMGTTVMREGELGDRYYAIADGEVEVTIGGQFVRRMRRDEGFGEIALLRSVPRTATITAVTDAVLLGIHKDVFLVELTGHAPTAAVAESIMRERDP